MKGLDDFQATKLLPRNFEFKTSFAKLSSPKSIQKIFLFKRFVWLQFAFQPDALKSTNYKFKFFNMLIATQSTV